MERSATQRKIADVLYGSRLFAGLTREHVEQLVRRLNARFVSVSHGDQLFPNHRPASGFDYLVEGEVHIIKHDAWGKRCILRIVHAGASVGGILAFTDLEYPPAEAIASTDCLLIALDRKRIAFKPDDPLCESFGTLIENFAHVLASSNVDLVEKCYMLSQKSVRKKLMAFFSCHAAHAGSSAFTIPYTRQQLADYLNIDRSVLSSELSRMRDDGLIDFSKNRFTIRDGVEHPAGYAV